MSYWMESYKMMEKKDSLKKIAMEDIEKDLRKNELLPKVGSSTIILNKERTAFEWAPVTVSNGYSQKFLALLNRLAKQLAEVKAELTMKRD